MYGLKLAVVFEFMVNVISIPGNGAKNLLRNRQVYRIVQVIKPVSTGYRPQGSKLIYQMRWQQLNESNENGLKRGMIALLTRI